MFELVFNNLVLTKIFQLIIFEKFKNLFKSLHVYIKNEGTNIDNYSLYFKVNYEDKYCLIYNIFSSNFKLKFKDFKFEEGQDCFVLFYIDNIENLFFLYRLINRYINYSILFTKIEKEKENPFLKINIIDETFNLFYSINLHNKKIYELIPSNHEVGPIELELVDIINLFISFKNEKFENINLLTSSYRHKIILSSTELNIKCEKEVFIENKNSIKLSWKTVNFLLNFLELLYIQINNSSCLFYVSEDIPFELLIKTEFGSINYYSIYNEDNI